MSNLPGKRRTYSRRSRSAAAGYSHPLGRLQCDRAHAPHEMRAHRETRRAGHAAQIDGDRSHRHHADGNAPGRRMCGQKRGRLRVEHDPLAQREREFSVRRGAPRRQSDSLRQIVRMFRPKSPIGGLRRRAVIGRIFLHDLGEGNERRKRRREPATQRGIDFAHA